jgi:hypothetical protein
MSERLLAWTWTCIHFVGWVHNRLQNLSLGKIKLGFATGYVAGLVETSRCKSFHLRIGALDLWPIVLRPIQNSDP